MTRIDEVQFSDGFVTGSITGTTNDLSLQLSETDSALKSIKVRKVSIRGMVGDVKVKFYDGVPTTSVSVAGLGDFYVSAQPDEGFKLLGKRITSGVLGVRLEGRTSGGSKAFFTIVHENPLQ